MNITLAKENIKRNYTRYDGYNGDTIDVGLSFDADSGCAIEVADSGCHRANSSIYANEREMLYYYDNHRPVHFPGVIHNIA